MSTSSNKKGKQVIITVVMSLNGGFSLPPGDKKRTVTITSLLFYLPFGVMKSIGKHFCLSSGCK